MKRIIVGMFIFVAVFAVALFPKVAQATVITYDLDVSFGADDPEGGTPWLTLTVDDFDSTGIVEVTMAAPNLTDDEFVSKWTMNIDPSFTDLSDPPLSIDWDSGEVAKDVDQNVDGETADGSGMYDIAFFFETKQADRFIDGEYSVYIFTLTGLEAESFSFFSTDGRFITAAHIQGIGLGDEGSGWVGAVPEPGTVLLLGSGLVGLMLYGRKRFRKETDKTS